MKIGAISAGHEATLETAKAILEADGNAYDAAVAAFLTSWIAEPCMSSAGGGAFANIRTQAGETMLYDFFCQTPKSNKLQTSVEFIPIHIDFGESQEVYYAGRGAMAVPGSIAGIFKVHEDLGSMPIQELFHFAIQQAKDGIPINRFQHYDLQLLESIFTHFPRANELFRPDDALINIGANLSLPFLADFLDYLWREGPDAFYKGEIAEKLNQTCADHGGFLTTQDLANYKVIKKKPLTTKFRAYSIFTNPLPATGGALLKVGLDYLNEIPNHIKPIDIFNAQQAMDQFEKNPEKLGEYLKGINRRGATSHFNILDKWGNAIALTMTLGEGSGYIIPGTDIHMNNMLGESALVPNGWHSWRPDARLSSMMSPTIATKDNDILITGSGGASRIPGALLQLINNVCDSEDTLKLAINKDRLHYEANKFDCEPNLDFDLLQLDSRIEAKRWNKTSMFFGGTHSILKAMQKIEAEGDPRRDGVSFVG